MRIVRRVLAKRIVAGLAALAGTSLAGCGQANFDNAVNTDLTQVDRIRSDATLEPQEKRERLARMGFDEVTINALLRDVRLGNQFGGDLESALDKVVGGSYATLTPDEVQAYGDATDLTTFSDESAQAIADLFVDRSINTADELQEYLDDPARVISGQIDVTSLSDVFVDFNPDDALDALP